MKDVQPGETTIYRNLKADVTRAGAIVQDETTGNEKIHITQKSGSNINLNNKVNSELAANNKQTQVLGDQYNTTRGNSYSYTNQNKEDRVERDFTLITGHPNFFETPVMDEWEEAQGPIAAAQASPEYTTGGFGNNTDVQYQADGTPDPDSGAVEGGSYSPNPAQADIPGVMEEQIPKLVKAEQKMGIGGSIKMLSAKHMLLQAGTKAVKFDSALITPNGKSVTLRYDIVDGEPKEIKTSVPVVEEKDTSGAVPFGDVMVSAGSKLRVIAGSGGVSIKTAGNANINATGRLMLGGAEVAIGGSTAGDAGRVTITADKDVFIKSGGLMTRVADYQLDESHVQHSFSTPHGFFTGDLEVQGNLVVHGCILAHGDITAGGPGGISLLKHKHSGVCTGPSNTGGPV